jgi:predicted dienelactone hydrolase
LQRFFESMDRDGDGVITWQEVDEAKAARFAELPKLQDVIGELPPETLALFGGKQHEVGWAEAKLHDASRKRDIGWLIRFPKEREGLTPIVLLSHGGYGNSFGQYAYSDLATTYARLGFLAVNIGHRQSANEMQHRYDRPLDVSFVIDALVRTRAAELRIPGGGSEGSLPMPEEFQGIPDVDHIGHIGHSFGAFTAHAVGGANFSPTMGIRNFRDPRVDAIVPISPQGYHRFGSYDEGPENNSWSDIRIPVYLICGERESPEWRRQPFDRYPSTGDKFFTIGKGWGHNIVQGDDTTKRLLSLNTALFFHCYLRGGDGRDKIGTLAWIDGWTLEKKVAPGDGNSTKAN